ncbi:MFS transporter [Aurantimonas sp. 22II-16-19i]|uniref:MFS transporter n=1 Tax=Aurantimonas sp. 22II-16-19i TaxID=1317114 RepID=UPI0009F8ED83|nr:MFS transporter [Aurantimonas sp. 22II-16-19i]
MTTTPTRNRWLVLAILSSALLLITIDVTVLCVALPRLTAALSASASQKLWIVNAYPLVMAGLLPGLGTLGDRLGHKRLFLTGLAVFGVASLLAAFAPSPAMLIAARVLLAVGAAAMMPATLSIIRLTFEDEGERSFAIGVWAAVASGGAALGPVFGGLILEHFWWGAVFLINVPVVVLALGLAAWLMPSRPGQAARPWDLVGSVQVLIGLVALAYAVKEVAKRDASLSHAALTLAIGLAAFVLFKRRQDHLTHKLIDFSLFRDHGFSAGVTAALVSMLSLIGFELVLSLRLQVVLGLMPLEAGLFILPIPLAALVTGPIAGALAPRLGAMNLLWGGLFLAGVGLALSGLSYDAPLLWQIPGFALLGSGLGATMTAASGVIMASAPADRAGMAASIEEVSFELGGAIGIAILGSVLTAVYGASLAVPAGSSVPLTILDSLDEALAAAATLPEAEADALREAAFAAFDQAVIAVIALAAALTLATALAIWIVGRRGRMRARSLQGYYVGKI